MNDRVKLLLGDCIAVMRGLEACSVDAVVCDPPYALTSGGSTGFMGATWDGPAGFRRAANPNDVGRDNVFGRVSRTSPEYKVGAIFQEWCEEWARECLRVLRPGGHLVAFGSPRTFHRLACGIEDAGFEVRDSLIWAFGSGFPKSLDVGKAIDKMAAPATEAARKWQGWGSALKPSYEPAVLARKPLVGTIAENVLRHGTGALNIDACRVPADGGRPLIEMDRRPMGANCYAGAKDGSTTGSRAAETTTLGRWPANLIHDGSEEVVGMFPQTESGVGAVKRASSRAESRPAGTPMIAHGDAGSAARFFYTAKADATERGDGNTHPTVKPFDLMRYLVRLVTPPGGLVLDPFMGSGTTGLAARAEGFRFIGIEREAEYMAIAERRMGADYGLVPAVVSAPRADGAQPSLFAFAAASGRAK